MEPAVWRAAEAPSIIIFVPAFIGFGGKPWEFLAVGREILADVTDCEGRHLVVADRVGRHRFLIKGAGRSTELACLLSPDSWHELRIAALSVFLGGPRSKSFAPTRGALYPSTSLAHRLGIMLRILDCIFEADGHVPSIRAIASRVVYPWADFGRSIEWKSSSERRQTQRLVNQARHMMNGGYRDLLKGRLRPEASQGSRGSTVTPVIA